jgi:hypothetical protein
MSGVTLAFVKEEYYDLEFQEMGACVLGSSDYLVYEFCLSIRAEQERTRRQAYPKGTR